jgi:hypothetical protein
VQKTSLLVVILVILVSIVASSSLGYLIGSGPFQSFQTTVVALSQTKTVTTTVVNYTVASQPTASTPIEPDPFDPVIYIRGSSLTWYVPIIYVGRGSTSQMYVSYVRPGCNPRNTSFDFLGINSQQPENFSINDQGKISNTTGVTFSLPAVVELVNDSETVLYTFSISPATSGYYSFSLPFACTPEPYCT